MPKATIVYRVETHLDLSDPDIREVLTRYLRANSVVGKARASDISDAIRESIASDPDELLPRFDDNFDESNCSITVEPSIEDDTNVLIVEPAEEDEDE